MNKVCLLITTFNRGTLLEKSLERLTRLTIPDEILIVDDGSNKQIDATEIICKGFSARLPLRYIYNNNPKHSICSMARNIGIKNTDCDIIITSEPELLFISDIIWQMIKLHKRRPDYVISAGTIYHMQEKASIGDAAINNPVGFLSRSIVEKYQTEPRPYNPEGFVKTIDFTATYCALYEKEWLMKINGWDEEFPGNYGFEDTDLLTRLRITGHNQLIDQEMKAIHMWHSHQEPYIEGQNVSINDGYFRSKNIESADSPHVYANKNINWGEIKI